MISPITILANSTLSFDALYDCVTQETAPESGGGVGYMVNMLAPVPLISPLKAQLTPSMKLPLVV